jgi:GrpB-like predicted nucleotidyltransferase (UPF0157 family)
MQPNDDIPAALTDEQIQAATIGGAPEHNATIELAEYDPEWPRLYAREEARIRAALGPKALLVEHVGSTSVPGLAAKPLIDVVLVVRDTRDEEAYVPPLESAGYVLRIREPDWFEHRLFKGPDTNVNGAHLPGRLRGGRPHDRVPRLAADARRRPRPVPRCEARAGGTEVEVRAELR